MHTTPHKSILEYTRAAAEALRDVATSTSIPFLGTVCSISIALIPVVQNVKAQRERCMHMMERVHQLLCILLVASTVPGQGVIGSGISTPKTLEELGQCAQVLQRFYSWLRTQQDLGKLKRILKHNEIAAQLDVCEREMNAVVAALKLRLGGSLANTLSALDEDAETRHQDFLELLAAQTQSGSMDTASLMSRSLFMDSANSLALLPASPHIFHGREDELHTILEALCSPSPSSPAPRIAILGTGGIGKTALALTVLHHPSLLSTYPLPNQRHFVSCESVIIAQDLIRAVAQHIGVDSPAAQNSAKVVVAKLREMYPGGQGRAGVIVLDNLETSWDSEVVGERKNVEDFLALIAEVDSVGLLVSPSFFLKANSGGKTSPQITMRGAERPASVQWTRPFLPVLQPLEPSATRQIFIDVADEPEPVDGSALDELLLLSDNLPLAASLMASAASIEGYTATLERWHAIDPFSDDDEYIHKNNSLDASIRLSLSNPRMRSAPQAHDLLSLLSILPDGIATEELHASSVPIHDLSHHVSTLLRLSLVYIEMHMSSSPGTAGRRLKTLTPIREYIRRKHPPQQTMAAPLLAYFNNLLSISNFYSDLAGGNLIPRLASHFANIREVMVYGLSVAGPDEKQQLSAIGHGILDLNYISVVLLKGPTPLLEKLPGIVEVTDDLRIRLRHNCQYIVARTGTVDNVKAEKIIEESLGYVNNIHLPVDQVLMLYNAIATYFMPRNMSKAAEYNALSLALAQKTLDAKQNILALDIKYHHLNHTCDGRGILDTVAAERAFGRVDVVCTLMEMRGNQLLGNLERVVQLCLQAREEIALAGLEASDRALAILDSMGDAHLGKTEFLEALPYYEELLRKTDLLGNAGYHVHAKCMLALIGVRTGQSEEEILVHLDSAEKVYRDRGSSRVLLAEWIRAEMELHIRKDKAEARAQFVATANKTRGMYTDVLLPCFAALGDPRNEMSSSSEVDTFHWAVVFLAGAVKTQDKLNVLLALRCLGDVFVDEDIEIAENLLTCVLDGATLIGIHRLQAECMETIGNIRMKEGKREEARVQWKEARDLFIGYAAMGAAEKVDRRLEVM
ncbi:hypothetical protein C8F01DRAFT_1375137 [Mycena amicta]|nr:hypothetical protein C8F01DRAFT_1375137 [Mycena amicta]